MLHYQYGMFVSNFVNRITESNPGVTKNNERKKEIEKSDALETFQNIYAR